MEHNEKCIYIHPMDDVEFYDRKLLNIRQILENVEIDITKELSELISKDYKGFYSKDFGKNKKHIMRRLFKDNDDEFVLMFKDTIEQIHRLKIRVGFRPLYKIYKFIY